MYKPHQKLVEEKSKEIDELLVAKTHLEHQLAGLTERMREKEEDSKMQVCKMGLYMGVFCRGVHLIKDTNLLMRHGVRKKAQLPLYCISV